MDILQAYTHFWGNTTDWPTERIIRTYAQRSDAVALLKELVAIRTAPTTPEPPIYEVC